MNDNMRKVMKSVALAAGVAALSANVAAQERIRIVSEWGTVTARLDDNPTARAFLRMLPLDIPMNDHLRQEKTSRLQTALPEHQRKLDFASGELGVWGQHAFVIYYTSGSVPPPGIVSIGRLEGSAELFNRPGPVKVRVERMK